MLRTRLDAGNTPVKETDLFPLLPRPKEGLPLAGDSLLGA